MCEWGDTVETYCPAGFSGENKKRIWVPVDRCIAPLVETLNDAGFHTVCSCCGHGKGPGRIDLDDGTVLTITRVSE